MTSRITMDQTPDEQFDELRRDKKAAIRRIEEIRAMHLEEAARCSDTLMRAQIGERR